MDGLRRQALTATPSTDATSTSATFAWSVTGAPTTTVCSLDGGVGSTCSSPQTYSSLAKGFHTFKVTVSNAYGAASGFHRWTIS